jgi:protein-glutamine gamma-glutamyltransferase
MLSKRDHTENLVTLLLSWLVYALCQGDFIIPGLALAAVLPSYFKQLFGRPSSRSYLNMSWRSLISIAIVLSALWRNFLPSPEHAVSFIPILLEALQTASIVIGVLAWFRFDYKWRHYYLKFLPWLTVALSINVPFKPITQLCFWLFCFLSVGFMVSQLYFPIQQESAQAMKSSKFSSPWLYAYPILFTVIALGIFLVVVRGIKMGDEVFTDLIVDYFGRKGFNLFESTLNLNGSGEVRLDVRPVLELEKFSNNPSYLVGQVFEEYNNGVWKAIADGSRQSLSDQVEIAPKRLDMVMFDYLGDVIPAPRDVIAMHSKTGLFYQDSSGIVHNLRKNIPKITLVMSERSRAAELDGASIKRLIDISAAFASYLRPRIDHIVGDQKDPLMTARELEQYFQKNFAYSLYVNFRADDNGILYLLDKKRPAFCSYFASAMTLMLRERGIPARLVAGFLVTEKTGLRSEKYIVRGRDAHAWVEAFLPDDGGASIARDFGQREKLVGRWYRFDPTPFVSRQTAMRAYGKINLLADWIWCSQKRMKAAIIDIETKTLVAMLFIVIIAVALEEILKKYVLGYWKNRKRSGENIGKLSRAMANPYQHLYDRFEDFLKHQLQIERKESQTDGELVQLLRGQPEISKDIITRVESFLARYHAARFGRKEDVDLSQEIWPLLKGSRRAKGVYGR